MPGTRTFRVLAPFIRCGDTAGEFDHFEAALDVALGIRDGLAALARQAVGKPCRNRAGPVRGISSYDRAGAALRIGVAA